MVSITANSIFHTLVNRYNAFVAVDTEEIVSLIDWVSDASYNILPLGTNDPQSGDRVLVVDPATAEASPLGWHSQATLGNYTGTIGNNVYAQVNPGKNQYQLRKFAVILKSPSRV
jgi:extracellular elastinolytic metalloproteinase